eukprot:403357028
MLGFKRNDLTRVRTVGPSTNPQKVSNISTSPLKFEESVNSKLSIKEEPLSQLPIDSLSQILRFDFDYDAKQEKESSRELNIDQEPFQLSIVKVKEELGKNQQPHLGFMTQEELQCLQQNLPKPSKKGKLTKKQLTEYAEILAEALSKGNKKEKVKMREELWPFVLEIFSNYVPEKPEKIKKVNDPQRKHTAFHNWSKEIVDQKRNLWKKSKITN